MVLKRLKATFFRMFKRGHPDIYTAFKHYCDEHGINQSDVAASAIAAWMASDEESKPELEKIMKERRTGGGGGTGSIDASLNVFTKVCKSMGEMFDAMNKARAGMSISAMLSDFKAVSSTISEMKGAASQAGKGSTEDYLLGVLLKKMFGEAEGLGGLKKKTGKGKVKKVED